MNGAASHRWEFINTGGNEWDFYTSEVEGVKQWPKLVAGGHPASGCDGGFAHMNSLDLKPDWPAEYRGIRDP